MLTKPLQIIHFHPKSSMHITKIDQNRYKDFQKINKIFWFQRNKIVLIILVILIIYSITLIANNNNNVTIPTKNNNATYSETITYLDPSKQVGLTLLSISLFFLFLILMKRYQFFSTIRNSQSLAEHLIGKVEYRFTDRTFAIHTASSKSEVQWELFASYKVKKKFLILKSKLPNGAPIWFNLHLLNPDEFDILNTFLKERIR